MMNTFNCTRQSSGFFRCSCFFSLYCFACLSSITRQSVCAAAAAQYLISFETVVGWRPVNCMFPDNIWTAFVGRGAHRDPESTKFQQFHDARFVHKKCSILLSSFALHENRINLFHIIQITRPRAQTRNAIQTHSEKEGERQRLVRRSEWRKKCMRASVATNPKQLKGNSTIRTASRK